MIGRRATLASTALLIVGTVTSSAADATLDGAVAAPLALSAALLKSLPRTTVDIAFQTAKGRESGHYAGVLLWELIGKAGLVNTAGKNTELRHSLVVTGRDGYAVALALGEIEPNYEAKKVVLAYEGGTPAVGTDRLRLVVPGDAHGGRSVADVVHIEVK